MNKDIQILDCTLRDGGLGLEDAKINKLSDSMFSECDYQNAIGFLNASNIDIIELGSIEISKDNKEGFGIYQTIEQISKQIPQTRNQKQLYVALYRGPDTPVEDIPEWNPELVDGVRVIIRYSELKKSLDFCTSLAKKGYKVFVQPMLTMRYSEEELDYIVNESNRMKAYALYFVDSYGYMQPKDVEYFVSKYDAKLDKSIRIGFHAHNNMNLAYTNVLSFIENDIDRGIVIDSCAIGMGQGAGNLQTELIIPYLNSYFEKYDYSAVLNLCEIIETYSPKNAWGYSVTRLLPALYKTAYKYSIVLRNTYHLTFAEINQVLKEMPNELRHRYSLDNLEKLLSSTNLLER